jgi:hypothetical protein
MNGMDNLGDDFIQAFSAKLPEFFDFFTKWWVYDKVISHADEKYGGKELMYWYFIQNCAKQKTEAFAKTLSQDAKSFVEPQLKEIEKHLEKLNSAGSANQ